MKDIPHHMRKLNRKVIRSEHHEKGVIKEDSLTAPNLQTEKQVKKQAKAQITKRRNARVPTHPSEEERNKKLAHQIPIFHSVGHGPRKITRKARKKTPRI